MALFLAIMMKTCASDGEDDDDVQCDLLSAAILE